MAKRGGRGAPKNNSLSCEDAEFFKVFLPDLHSHQLMIPPDYMKYFSRTIRERVILKDTAGKIWHVSVEKTRDGVFLKNGWQSFVNHHLLSLGEFLVFKYDKSFSFLVKIYGINACKKEIFAANDDITTRVKVEEKQTLGKRARPLNTETDIPSDSSECPFFVSPLSHPKQYRLKIPKHFFERHNLHVESEMVLRDAKGKEWEVQVSTYNNGYGHIAKGWSQFRIDNNLGPKDCCKLIFGAEKPSRVIRVQVLRNVTDKKLRC